jgi:hypothetical protein
MNRGPAPGRAPDISFLEKAAAAWGAPPPDWIAELAGLADREGLAGAAGRIRYSRSAVSTIIAGKYAGDMDRVEQMVRGALMAAEVECPVLGAIGRDRCLTEQKQPWRATSAIRVRLYHACRSGCPHARQKEE